VSSLHLGLRRPIGDKRSSSDYRLPAHHLVTHGVVVGMTGSGKTGLVTVTIEEALKAGIPVLVIDVKGDLPNLRLVPDFAPSSIDPWIDGSPLDGAKERQARLARLAADREEGRSRLESWGIDDDAIARYRTRVTVHVRTPGSTAGEPLHLLSGLERPSSRWDTDDPESARATLSRRDLARAPPPRS
jgi:DNA helicase HerA-like ATPase